MKKYIAGNWLRGFFEGEFKSMDEAWSYLSKRFLLSYPAKRGRYIYMYVQEENGYGLSQLILCKPSQITELNKLPENIVMERCSHSNHRLL